MTAIKTITPRPQTQPRPVSPTPTSPPPNDKLPAITIALCQTTVGLFTAAFADRVEIRKVAPVKGALLLCQLDFLLKSPAAEQIDGRRYISMRSKEWTRWIHDWNPTTARSAIRALRSLGVIKTRRTRDRGHKLSIDYRTVAELLGRYGLAAPPWVVAGLDAEIPADAPNASRVDADVRRIRPTIPLCQTAVGLFSAAFADRGIRKVAVVKVALLVRQLHYLLGLRGVVVSADGRGYAWMRHEDWPGWIADWKPRTSERPIAALRSLGVIQTKKAHIGLLLRINYTVFADLLSRYGMGRPAWVAEGLERTRDEGDRPELAAEIPASTSADVRPRPSPSTESPMFEGMDNLDIEDEKPPGMDDSLSASDAGPPPQTHTPPPMDVIVLGRRAR